MPAHEQKQCQRCNRTFECKSGSILLCQCQTVMLSPDALSYIGGQFQDCLCAKCLRELRDEYESLPEQKGLSALEN
ncbi:MAG: cysteine-rich CWC family protein [Gammaproteobacteria bacterium]|nr:cysteine-rich CWC family protein [Gammaproteobacteria bacterium]MDH5593036.1 cysteine-rich CWC family protein [Gammaproteobacteria bacterium]MDH5613859.1 cysteine-rich CWC family protein [Gammaproteobacteria bacterium]